MRLRRCWTTPHVAAAADDDEASHSPVQGPHAPAQSTGHGCCCCCCCCDETAGHALLSAASASAAQAWPPYAAATETTNERVLLLMMPVTFTPHDADGNASHAVQSLHSPTQSRGQLPVLHACVLMAPSAAAQVAPVPTAATEIENVRARVPDDPPQLCVQAPQAPQAPTQLTGFTTQVAFFFADRE